MASSASPPPVSCQARSGPKAQRSKAGHPEVQENGDVEGNSEGEIESELNLLGQGHGRDGNGKIGAVGAVDAIGGGGDYSKRSNVETIGGGGHDDDYQRQPAVSYDVGDEGIDYDEADDQDDEGSGQDYPEGDPLHRPHRRKTLPSLYPKQHRPETQQLQLQVEEQQQQHMHQQRQQQQAEQQQQQQQQQAQTEAQRQQSGATKTRKVPKSLDSRANTTEIIEVPDDASRTPSPPLELNPMVGPFGRALTSDQLLADPDESDEGGRAADFRPPTSKTPEFFHQLPRREPEKDTWIDPLERTHAQAKPVKRPASDDMTSTATSLTPPPGLSQASDDMTSTATYLTPPPGLSQVGVFPWAPGCDFRQHLLTIFPQGVGAGPGPTLLASQDLLATSMAKEMRLGQLEAALDAANKEIDELQGKLRKAHFPEDLRVVPDWDLLIRQEQLKKELRTLAEEGERRSRRSSRKLQEAKPPGLSPYDEVIAASRREQECREPGFRI